MLSIPCLVAVHGQVPEGQICPQGDAWPQRHWHQTGGRQQQPSQVIYCHRCHSHAIVFLPPARCTVRIFLGGYLYAVTQHLLTRRNFLFLNFLKGFPRSLGQRPHVIDFTLSFDSLLAISFLSHHFQPSFESFAMLVFEAQPAILIVYQTQ